MASVMSPAELPSPPSPPSPQSVQPLQPSQAPQPLQPPEISKKTQAEPRFWSEVYWFTLITLGGIIFALFVLPPRLARQRQLLEVEAELGAGVSCLQEKQAEYETAIMALESDPFWREEVYRTRLGVLREGEEFLKPQAPAGR